LARAATLVDGILYAGNADNLAEMIVLIGKKHDSEMVTSYTPIRSRGSTKDRQVFLLLGFEKMGKKIAKRALERFGSPEEVFYAIMNGQIKELEGVGEGLAKKWKDALQEQYAGSGEETFVPKIKFIGG